MPKPQYRPANAPMPDMPSEISVKASATFGKQSWLGRSMRLFTTLAITGLIISAMAAGIFVLQMRAAAEAPVAANPPVSVSTIPVTRQQSYKVAAQYVGRLEAARETEVAFERGGLVMDVAFEEGEQVAQGALIAKLDTQQLEAQRMQLEAQRRELIAQRDLAKATLKRQKKLSRKGWSPEQQFDEARFEVSRLDAAIDRIDAQLKLNAIDVAKSDVIAPFAGTVGARMIDTGAVVAAGTPILNLLETSARQARIGLPADVAQSLKPGSAARLKSGQVTAAATLLRKRQDLATGTRTVTGIFAVDGMQTVPLGEVVTLSLDQEIEAPGVWLPIASLNEGRKGLWSVLIAREDSTGNRRVEREAVEILHTADGRVYAEGAFRDGDRVVTKGTNRVIPGQRVALADQP